MIWNSAYYWGIPARALHWAAALLVAVLFIHGSLWLEDWDDAGEAGRGALAWHASAGITLIAVMLVRLVWRLFNRTPMMPAVTPDWEKRVAHLAHAGLYAVTFVAALTGWLATGGIEPPLRSQLFWLLDVPPPGWSGGEIVRELHELSVNLLVALAAAHAVAALWHHFVMQDSILRRMLLRGQVRRR